MQLTLYNHKIYSWLSYYSHLTKPLNKGGWTTSTTSKYPRMHLLCTFAFLLVVNKERLVKCNTECVWKNAHFK